jgi:hypothetical protein
MRPITFLEGSFPLGVDILRVADKIDIIIDGLSKEVGALFLSAPNLALPPLDLQEPEDWQDGPVDPSDGLPPDHP